ncbi:MAG: hypothetical protein ACTSX1_00700 [Candidatus Heimdallarchaeaceae archaeon]
MKKKMINEMKHLAGLSVNEATSESKLNIALKMMDSDQRHNYSSESNKYDDAKENLSIALSILTNEQIETYKSKIKNK